MFCMLFIMIKVKLIVTLFYIVSCACYSKYCEISPYHVLCKYPRPGPSVSCKEYDGNSFLTDDDINSLVNQINVRRNFIAFGHSKHLPGAANMKKIVWSKELATFAQRWVDQCDPSLRPDKEDQCRDLDYIKVGQNIASILNPSAGFNIKSFIEMWFMQSLDYSGSISYYNQFQDLNSGHFLQLIWAETEKVGCGRAKFKVNNKNIERLVCNFSPKGNIHGKPVYIIGFPGTQCLNKMVPDEKFKGLCTHQSTLQTKLTTTKIPVSGLLRILNLSNDSVKHEIDPIYNNIKQIDRNTNETESPRHQMMRHIFRNDVMPRTETPFQAVTFWENAINASRSYREYIQDHERGHSRLYHSQIDRHSNSPTKNNQVEDLRKHYTNHESLRADGNYCKHLNKQCTRNTMRQDNDCERTSTIPSNEIIYRCTRRQTANCEMSTQGCTVPVTNYLQHVVPHEMCPCSTYTYLTKNTQPQYNLNCECVNDNGPKIRCPNLLRRFEDHTTTTKNIIERHGNLNDKLSKDVYSNAEYDNDWLVSKSQRNKPNNKRSGYIQSNRDRKKREFGDLLTGKPSWKIDNLNKDRNPQLKALRYTTIINKRRSKDKKYPSKSISTETITVNLKNSRPVPVTEKYLSFDELLHLRKLNTSTYSVRRKMNPEILRDDTTVEYTVNTPFVRIKYCTRKLTCTWTASTLTDVDGNIIPAGGARGSGGGGGIGGPKTPPGYVEGCTRTSTCTRDFMNRNKFPTLTTFEASSIDDGEDGPDYCERRSLNIKKRNYFKKKRSLSTVYTKIYPNTKYRNGKLIDDLAIKKDNLRIKKRHIKRKHITSNLSYGDLYYLVLRKITGKWKNHRKANHFNQCHCDNASKMQNLMITMFFTIYISVPF